VSNDTCQPRTFTRWPTGKNGWRRGTITIKCQHGHAFGVIYPGEWAGGFWEAWVGKHRAEVRWETVA
jgi:hypothetical protein